MYPGTRTANEPGESYGVNEASTSVFGQLNFSSDAGVFGIPYSGNIGVRVRTSASDIGCHRPKTTIQLIINRIAYIILAPLVLNFVDHVILEFP